LVLVFRSLIAELWCLVIGRVDLGVGVVVMVSVDIELRIWTRWIVSAGRVAAVTQNSMAGSRVLVAERADLGL
jgi:hypothetical protein